MRIIVVAVGARSAVAPRVVALAHASVIGLAPVQATNGANGAAAAAVVAPCATRRATDCTECHDGPTAAIAIA